MFETFFGFKKAPFASTPDPKQLFESAAWSQLKARLQFLTDHRGAGLVTGEAGSGKSTAARTWLAALNPNLYKIIYLHWSSGSALDLLRQLARDLDLEPAHFKGDLVDQIADAIVRLNKPKNSIRSFVLMKPSCSRILLWSSSRCFSTSTWIPPPTSPCC